MFNFDELLFVCIFWYLFPFWLREFEFDAVDFLFSTAQIFFIVNAYLDLRFCNMYFEAKKLEIAYCVANAYSVVVEPTKNVGPISLRCAMYCL